MNSQDETALTYRKFSPILQMFSTDTPEERRMHALLKDRRVDQETTLKEILANGEGVK